MTIETKNLTTAAASAWGWPATLGERLEKAFGWRDLTESTLAAVADAGEETRVNRALVRAIGEHGLLRELFPPLDPADRRISAVTLCLLKESLGQRSTATEDALGLQGLGFNPIYRWGSEEQVDEWYEPVVSGDAVAAFAMTEPDAGSDVAALALEAHRDGGDYLLSGTKVWISNAPDADVYVVFARTGNGNARTSQTAFIVPGDAPGLTGEPLELIVSHPVGRLVFDNVRVPSSAVVGEVGQGWEIGMKTLEQFRISVGAFGLAVSQAALDATISFLKRREQFGAPLSTRQALAHRVAELTSQLTAARLLIYHTAERFDAGEPDGRLSAMAKLRATETAQEVVDACVQMHGACALEQGHLLGHLYREVRAPRIYEGASEVLREIAARSLFAAAP
ncbi:acyl-CoA dehydrogenase family protein [Conexibacter woesei]|uniref:Acyl-CoA dehydrogenase domain protein n=1 Tax=Conexibacter woesei (strain DSM 14684 / CCUG 47730 / CIP 108061 / JCM 11494 / NBRC 100937 / ID131577) TaxID=469383 RepID=D3F7S0_CONWI|nr:acyl-CoA dehydrogenase [Conexibacter woesei]ADB52814.1 acyl-CoA dehydrogenase domain protein [Conexibacter woesei DSM 14684]